MAELWEKYFLNDEMLKKHCESPTKLCIPVCECVHVRKDMGYLLNGKWWRAIPSYVIPGNVEQLTKVCGKWEGWTLRVHETLDVKDWRRGWTSFYYPYSKNSILKCVLPGMVRVALEITDVKLALESLRTCSYIPVCPTCTLEEYETPNFREVFDMAMSRLIQLWLNGRPHSDTLEEDDE